jgi:hypothetical protein
LPQLSGNVKIIINGPYFTGHIQVLERPDDGFGKSMTLKAGASTITRRPTLLILAIVLLGLVWLRTFHPLLLPIYYDEALHIERAERTLTERTLLMGTEGGKYLEIWLIALILPFTEDPLLTARLLSAVFATC